ncbi:LPXTG cell wall anchor domain-containing protein [Secundilactobacillus muriivasis]
MKKNSKVVERLLISTLVLGGLVVTGATGASADGTASSAADTTSSQPAASQTAGKTAANQTSTTTVAASTSSDSSSATSQTSAAPTTVSSESSATGSSESQTSSTATRDTQQQADTSLTTATKVTSTITDTAGNKLPQSAQNQLKDSLNQVTVSDKGKYSLADVMPDKLTTTDNDYQLNGITITTTAGAQQHTYQITYNADGTANITMSDLTNPDANQTINNVSKANVDLILANGQLTGYGQPGTALQIAYLYTLLAKTTDPTTPTDSNSGQQTGIVDDSPVASRTQVDATSTTLPTETKTSTDNDTVLPTTTTKPAKTKTSTTSTEKDNDTVVTETDGTQGTGKATRAELVTNGRGVASVSTPMTTHRATVSGVASNDVTANDATDNMVTTSDATLPQTSEHETTVAPVLGAVLLTIASWLGLSAKKHREN